MGNGCCEEGVVGKTKTAFSPRRPIFQSHTKVGPLHGQKVDIRSGGLFAVKGLKELLTSGTHDGNPNQSNEYDSNRNSDKALHEVNRPLPQEEKGNQRNNATDENTGK